MYAQPSEPSRISPVIGRTDELSKALMELSERIKILTDRLSPLRRETAIISKKEEGRPMPAKSPLMFRLDNLEGQIQFCSQSINELLDELDV